MHDRRRILKGAASLAMSAGLGRSLAASANEGQPQAPNTATPAPNAKPGRPVAEAAALAEPGLGHRLLHNAIAPGMRRFLAATQAMEASLEPMCHQAKPWDAPALKGAFAELVTSWSAIAFLRFGPVVAENRFERVFFWPDPRGVMPRQIRSLLARPEAIPDATGLRTHSVALQGLPALEFLLYGEPGLLASGPASASCRHALAITGNLASIAAELWQAWGEPGPYGLSFATPTAADTYYRHAGEVAGEALKALSTGLRFEADVKLRTALGADLAQAKPRALPYWRSGLSLAALAASVDGMANLYSAAHFPLPAWLNGNLEQELRQSQQLLQGLASQGNAFPTTEDNYRELTLVRLKLDNARQLVDESVAPLLGVGLGFNALDGD